MAKVKLWKYSKLPLFVWLKSFFQAASCILLQTWGEQLGSYPFKADDLDHCVTLDHLLLSFSIAWLKHTIDANYSLCHNVIFLIFTTNVLKNRAIACRVTCAFD